MSWRVVMILALGSPTAFGLMIKTNETFGLDTSLDGIPQKTAKLFALAASGKATSEMFEPQLQELFDKFNSYPEEKQMKLAQIMEEMFPKDAVDLDEVIEWKHSSKVGSMLKDVKEGLEAQSLLQVSEGELATEKNPIPDLLRDNWNPYYDDWRERGLHQPTMRGPYPESPKLEKNLRITEENIWQDNCRPDGFLSCYTKDITYLPCRVFNMCMMAFETFGTRLQFYAQDIVDIPQVEANVQKYQNEWWMGIGLCHYVNAVVAKKLGGNAVNNPLANGIGATNRMAHQTSGGEGRQTSTAGKGSVDYSKNSREGGMRIPCSVAYEGNPRLYKLGRQIRAVERDFVLNPPKHLTGSQAKKNRRTVDKLREMYDYELSKELQEWADDPVAYSNKHKVFDIDHMQNAGVWVAQRESGGVPGGFNIYGQKPDDLLRGQNPFYKHEAALNKAMKKFRGDKQKDAADKKREVMKFGQGTIWGVR